MNTVQITPAIYKKIGEDLLEKIGRSEFFNDTIEFESPEFNGSFMLTAVIYRDKTVAPDYVSYPIVDIVPTWWQFDTADEDGACFNNFQFSELKNYIRYGVD